MLKISAPFSTYRPCSFKNLSCQQASKCSMQRTMLAAATEEGLIAPQYMIQISANLAFSYTKRELFAS